MMETEQILKIILSFSASFVITFTIIPTIVRVSKIKGLVDKPTYRSSHQTQIPNLGGLAIFAGFSISSALCIDISALPYYQFIVASVIIIFFVGVKDDILIIAPITKLVGQFIAALVLVVLGDIRISNLHGFFDINEINYYLSVAFSIFLILVILNGFNFIDGVDGLSASIAIITSGTFAYWFFLIKEYQLTILALSLIGGIFAFFLYNVFGRKNKIFMGDTGSLIIGIILSVLAIKFNELNLDRTKRYFIYPAPTVSFAILIIPLFDLMRVVFVRLFTGRSLFKPDKNHLHHQLLSLGLTHANVSLIISGINLFFIYLAFYTAQFMSIRRQLLLVLIIAVVISYILSILVARKK